MQIKIGDKVLPNDLEPGCPVGEVVKVDTPSDTVLQIGVLFPGDSDPIYFEEDELELVSKETS